MKSSVWDSVLQSCRMESCMWELPLGNPLLGNCRLTTFAWGLTSTFEFRKHGLGTVASLLSLENSRLRTSLGNFRVGTFVPFRLRTFAWEISLGNLNLETVAWRAFASSLSNWNSAGELGSFMAGEAADGHWGNPGARVRLPCH